MPVDVAGDAGVVHDDDRAHVLVEEGGEVLGVEARACAARCRRRPGRRPARAKASAVVVNVNDGTITVSPGPRSSSIAESSRAAVHEVVISTSAAPVCSASSAAARAARTRRRTTGWPPRMASCT